jgi:aminoglycoside 6-adenylyltransferase
MRSEQEMYELILSTARDDDRVRAVILNGSRANPHAPRDFFQDYDVVFVVTEVASFRRDRDWIRRFGELMILQLPDDMADPAPEGHDGYGYLMQFADGNRIDLGLWPVAKLGELEEDSLSVLLLDKDGIIPPLAPANESGYLPKPPTSKQFGDCCNEFWWVCPYVAKGLWREQIVYARYMFGIVHEQLMKMVAWYIGVKTGFSEDPGKYGKYYQRYLEPDVCDMLLGTYSDAGTDHTWQALTMTCNLFRLTALHVAEHLGLEYPHGDDARVSAHLRHVRTLPKDAREMY